MTYAEKIEAIEAEAEVRQERQHRGERMRDDVDKDDDEDDDDVQMLKHPCLPKLHRKTTRQQCDRGLVRSRTSPR